MKKYILSLCLLALSTIIFAQQKTITGFKDASKQMQLEASFDNSLSATRIGETIKELSAIPHHLGSSGGKVVAESILQKLKSYGFDANIETYQVLFPTPKTRLLELNSPIKFVASLKEPALKEDPSSGQDGQLPIYNAWSGDGDVTAPLVFVNYGLPADYEKLAEMGISVKGKIVIAKYGMSWRGIKPKVAYENGAIGCLIYSDPMDDGYSAGDVYPKGAFKNEYGAQRGSVMDMVIHPGDPSTPFTASTANAKRLDYKDASTIMKIPVLPISYHDAKPLLEALQGPVAPAAWRGTLPITYHVGPSSSTVHLKLAFDWKIVPNYNIIGKIIGANYPDQWVIRGNHHDAWVNGANDPISGMAALLEEAKAIGDLVKNGYKPDRTIVYCGWDGEEPSLIGSTEWVEDHADELKKKTVIYINTDGNGRGFLDAGGSQALSPMVDEIAKTVIDPQTKTTVFERRKAAEATQATSATKKKDAWEAKAFELGALGSGSDYSSFLQHLAIPSLNVGYGGEDDGGEYHSIYDSYAHYAKFKDPGFAYGVTLAQTTGRMVLRMANAETLPFNFINLYQNINKYTAELIGIVANMRENTAIENQLLKANVYSLGNDPTTTFVPAKPKAEVPFLDFSAMQNALKTLENAATGLNERLKNTAPNAGLNEKLYKAEQQLTLLNGLPRRPWYKHALYAPGFYTGYGVKTLPGIREAIEQRNWQEMSEQMQALASAINKLAGYLEGI